MINDNKVLFNETEIQLLKSLGFSKNDIKFIEAYSSNEDIIELLTRASEKESYLNNIKEQIKKDRKVINDKRRNRKSQARYVVGGYILNHFKDIGLIDDEENILIENSNYLNDSFQPIVDQMIKAIDKTYQ
ncbi:MAG: hypothetical protein LUG60_02265 [Erysipelotrichaceae bacterium]|nr:hypothetical protein [Erysipelotrichaceae bacterium]